MALRDKLREVISIKDSPGRVATSFAIGVFIGMSPVLGLHTALGLVVAWIFRLNKFVTMIGVFVTNPWTIIPIYTFSTWVGAKLLRVEKIIPAIDWNGASIVSIMRDMKPLFWPFVCGTILIGLISAVIGYIIIYHAVARKRNE
ncbi:MAG: DUF2062 domain-containing protein [Nitrospirae bacterium]|nr:DUF2062 domain-containing protein [Nitrospirota bacterium]